MSLSEKIRTGIPGLDSILSGGLRDGMNVVLSGQPGSGKTTMGMQFLYYGAKDFDESGIFVTLSESPNSIKNNFLSYGWDIQDLIEQGKIINFLCIRILPV